MINLMTFLGVAAGFVLVFFSINSIAPSMAIYYSLSGIGIIAGGLLAITFISYRSTGFVYLIATVWEILVNSIEKPKYVALRFTEYAKNVMQNGYIALEKELPKLEEQSIEKIALEMLIAGYSKEDLKYIIENNTIERLERLKDNAKLLKNLASYAPAFGMIGTVIGLIAMLHNMGSDISSIGPAMSIALITTLYGIALSMLIFTPLAEKLRKQYELEAVNFRIILDGITYLHEKRNYVFMRDALNAHLLPKYRLSSDAK